jgi:hypothetical protein
MYGMAAACGTYWRGQPAVSHGLGVLHCSTSCTDETKPARPASLAELYCTAALRCGKLILCCVRVYIDLQCSMELVPLALAQTHTGKESERWVGFDRRQGRGRAWVGGHQQNSQFDFCLLAHKSQNGGTHHKHTQALLLPPLHCLFPGSSPSPIHLSSLFLSLVMVLYNFFSCILFSVQVLH